MKKRIATTTVLIIAAAASLATSELEGWSLSDKHRDLSFSVDQSSPTATFELNISIADADPTRIGTGNISVTSHVNVTSGTVEARFEDDTGQTLHSEPWPDEWEDTPESISLGLEPLCGTLAGCSHQVFLVLEHKSGEPVSGDLMINANIGSQSSPDRPPKGAGVSLEVIAR